MKAKIRMFLGAFFITCVLIGGLVGFMAVDLSTQRYMPGQFPYFWLIGLARKGQKFLGWAKAII